MATPNNDQDVMVEETPVTEGPQEPTISVPETPEGESEEVETPEKAKEPSESEETPEDVKNLSVKAQERFHSLSKGKAEAEKKVEVLNKELEALRKGQRDEFTAELGPQPLVGEEPLSNRLPWESEIEPGQPKELSVEDYKRDVAQTADWLVRARLGQVEKANEVKSDLDRLQAKYDVLNPESEKFDKDLSTKLAGLFKNQLKVDRSSTLYSFVESIMDVRERGRDEGREEVSATLAEQKSQEALTPAAEDSSDATEVKYEDMSLADKEKWLKDHGLWEN